MTYPNRENDFLSFPVIFIRELLSIPDVFRIIMLFFPAVYPQILPMRPLYILLAHSCVWSAGGELP